MNGEEAYFLSRAFTKNYSPSASDTYTKTEVNTLLSTKADTDAVTTQTSTAQAHILTPTGEGKGFIKSIYGMSVQDGTPTPSDPVVIEDSLGNFTVTDSDATNTQTITTGITLRAIEVTSSDDYNLEYDDKYYIADSIDWVDGTGYVLTQRIVSVSVTDFTDWTYASSGSQHSVYIGASTLFSASVVLPSSDNDKAIIISDYTTVQSRNALVLGTLECVAIGISGNLIFQVADTTSKDDYVAWITDKTLTFNAILATPTTSTLTTAQTTALLGLVTYDEATNITPTAEPYPVSVVEYGESRVASLALSNHNEIEILKL